MRRFTLRLIVAVVLLSALAACSPGASAPDLPEGVQAIEPPRPVSDITLITQEGTPLRMSELNGNHVLVAFGYTHCPDVCPITLAHFKRVKQLLGESAANVDFVFVSVDSRRDTPQVLQQYLAYFREDFIGLTGDAASLLEFATSYGAQYTINDAGGFAENYTVDHTAGCFLLNADGQLMRFYAYALEPDVIATDIAGILQG